MQSSQETARAIVAQYFIPNDGPSPTELVSLIAAALDEARAQERTEWKPVEPKPADWDTEYSVVLTGKNLEAMHYLARFVLDNVRYPSPLPFGVIASADHLFCLAEDIRRALPTSPTNTAQP